MVAHTLALSADDLNQVCQINRGVTNSSSMRLERDSTACVLNYQGLTHTTQLNPTSIQCVDMAALRGVC